MGEQRFDGRILTEEAIAEQARINAARDEAQRQELAEGSRLASLESAKDKIDPEQLMRDIERSRLSAALLMMADLKMLRKDAVEPSDEVLESLDLLRHQIDEYLGQ